MQANTSQINNLVIDKLALHYKCRWDKDTHPQEYAALVNAIVEAIYTMEIESHHLSARMADFALTWKYTRWPMMAELVDFLKPHKHAATTTTKLPEGKISIDMDYSLRRQIKHHWLKRCVEIHGNPDAPEVISPLTKKEVRLPNAYHIDNGHILRLLLWHDKKIDELTLSVGCNPSLDWWSLVEGILPSAADVKTAIRMESTEVLPALGTVGGIPAMSE